MEVNKHKNKGRDLKEVINGITKISIFYNATDCNNNLNAFASYSMNAAYDTNGLLIDYKVTKN